MGKMLKAKVPRPAIELKMKSKNLDPKILDDPEALIPESEPKQKNQNSGLRRSSTSGILGGGKKLQPKKPEEPPKPKEKILRRKFHWRKISKFESSDGKKKTVWS